MHWPMTWRRRPRLHHSIFFEVTYHGCDLLEREMLWLLIFRLHHLPLALPLWDLLLDLLIFLLSLPSLLFSLLPHLQLHLSSYPQLAFHLLLWMILRHLPQFSSLLLSSLVSLLHPHHLLPSQLFSYFLPHLRSLFLSFSILPPSQFQTSLGALTHLVPRPRRLLS